MTDDDILADWTRRDDCLHGANTVIWFARCIERRAVAAERERWEQERHEYRSLLMQARIVLRGPHTEQNIVVRELIGRIEARGVQFSA